MDQKILYLPNWGRQGVMMGQNKKSIPCVLRESSKSFRIGGKGSHFILWFSVIFLILMFVWAKFAVLDEVTTAHGRVISSQKTKVIQNLEGGIVKDIFIKEGETVEKGQILMKLDDIKFASQYKEGKLKEEVFKIKIARLIAELENKEFVVSPKLLAKLPELVKSERFLYQSKISEWKALRHRYKLLQKELKLTKPLLKGGAVSEVELLHLQQKINESQREISKFRSTTLQELNAAKAELSRLKEQNFALEDQLARTKVRSPVKGIVKQIYVSTIGGVVKPGMPLVEVVPLDDTLLIEAKVLPRDIGFLHSGQEAVVKITAYDFSIYGGLNGKVEHISADTTIDAKGNSYYEVWVRTGKNYLEKGGKKLKIIPGMLATVDVLTGNKTVLDYILKPILKTRQTALRER